MVMRISSLQTFNNGVNGLQRNYANATRTQEQIASGNRILTPADDPVASVRLLQLEQQKSVLDQYGSNLTAAKNSLDQEEVTLNSVDLILQRVRELSVMAGNGSLDTAGRQALAAELGQREDELLGLVNSRNARGEYLFSGFQGKTQPFVRQADGTYSYEGDEGQRKLQVASSLDVPISDNGKKLFQDILNAARLDSVVATPLPAGSTLTASAPLVQDEVTFSGNPGFPDTGIEVRFDAVDPKKYDVYGIPAGAVLASGRMDDDPDKTDQLTFRGVAVQLGGAAVGGESISITADPGRQKQGVLDTIANLRKVLADPDSTSGQARDAVAAAITNFDNALVNVDGVRGEVGARLNVIDSTMTDNEDVALVNKSVQAELRELDYPEALSRLAFETIILEAAQQSFIKISGLNLFSKM